MGGRSLSGLYEGEKKMGSKAARNVGQEIIEKEIEMRPLKGF